jgi:superfamily II DNA/RNA helicase
MFCVVLQMPTERQTMLFSATLPHWVQKVARRYQRDPKTIDLVGEDQTGKLNEDVTLNVIQVRLRSHTAAAMWRAQPFVQLCLHMVCRRHCLAGPVAATC